MYPALLPDEAVRLSQGEAKRETEGCVAICNCLAPYLVTNVIRGVGRGFIYNYNLHPEYRLYHVLLYLRCVPFFPRKLAGISCDGHVNRGKR